MDILTYAMAKSYANKAIEKIAPIPSGNTLPTSGDEGDYFVLLVDTTNNAKGFYRHNGTAWIMIANASDYVMIHASSHTTEQGYVVPVLTDEEITSAYNGIVAGKNVFIVDDLDTITIQVYDAGNIDDIAIRIIFTDALIITYKVGGEIVSKVLGGGGTDDYEELTNKPTINDVELSGNKTLSDLGIQADEDSSLETTDKTIVGAINEIYGEFVDIADLVSGGGIDE